VTTLEITMPCAVHPDVLNDLSTCSRCGKSFCGNCIITLRGAAVCAGCKSATIQDVRSGTEEGDLNLAGRGARFGAALIDNIILFVGVIVIAIVIGVLAVLMAGKPSEGTAAVIGLSIYGFLFLGIVGYEGLMLSRYNGQTLGKKLVGIKVVAPDGGPVTTGQAWGRGGARLLLGMTIGVIDVLFIFSKNRTTLHDRMAKTRVVMAKD
jgi:uncharacterized RDD family membrane protein YckC